MYLVHQIYMLQVSVIWLALTLHTSPRLLTLHPCLTTTWTVGRSPHTLTSLRSVISDCIGPSTSLSMGSRDRASLAEDRSLLSDSSFAVMVSNRPRVSKAYHMVWMAVQYHKNEMNKKGCECFTFRGTVFHTAVPGVEKHGGNTTSNKLYGVFSGQEGKNSLGSLPQKE